MSDRLDRNAGWTGSGLGRPSNEREWLAALRKLVAEGQCFLAYDLSQKALQDHPDSVKIRFLGALALMRCGATAEARRLLGRLQDSLGTTDQTAREAIGALRRCLPGLLAVPAGEEPPAALLDQVAAAAREMVRLGGRLRADDPEDHELLELLAQIHLETWSDTGQEADLRRSRDSHLSSFKLSARPDHGVRAAMLSWLLREPGRARELAFEAIAALRRQPADRQATFALLANEAEAQLLLDDVPAALELFRAAALSPATHYSQVVPVRQRFALLRERGFPVPGEVFDILRPPVLVVFAGEPVDLPGQSRPTFPPHLEGVVKDAIQRRLHELDAAIGYCSAACGSDLLFVEAMIERNAEVHLFLPCAVDDFVAARVSYAGPRWEQRFRAALRLATTVSFATEERYLGHDMLFRFNNQVIDGMARLRARMLDTEPYLMLVWDYETQQRAGTAADFMDHWPDIARLRLIEIDELRAAAPPPSLADRRAPIVPKPPVQEPERVVKAMLFGDIVGFSKLSEESLPGLWQLLEDLKASIEPGCRRPGLVESWGDALYVVMPDARSLLEYAFALQQGFAAADPLAYRLPHPLMWRIGLHAGPVFEGRHPLTGRTIIYGSHVSRTARIEPVTVPGEIYASQQFVALLTAEENAVRHERQMTGERYAPWYRCEYLGIQALAKNYGDQPVYHLRRLGTAGSA
ncbi:MAG: hypothetical protein ING52_13105 [Burkholderiales bacterium]|nr:hypothetical protein [Burkholderiales bacterium]